MRQSTVFAKTNKDAKQFESVNATLLQKAGFIDQTMAGVYTFLPLGLRVLTKIEAIIREEMDLLGSEVLMPSIAPKQLWEQTGRLETVDVLMKTMAANKLALAKNDAEYILNSTHEEVVTPIAKQFHWSYKDFPFAVYQIQTKFRNEPRAKSGLLRCREFRMKDLYSFHTSEADLAIFYERAKKAYAKVFERLGLGDDTLIALASGGDFTDGYSHEFQTVCEAGEDTLFIAKKAGIVYNREVAPSASATVYTKESARPLEAIKREGVTGVAALVKDLNIPIEKTTKTMLYQADGVLVAAAVRGDYEVSVYKLRKIIGCKTLELASSEMIMKATGSEIGYAGLLDLPKEIPVYCDDALKGRMNFEMGANKTNYHSINVNFGRDLPEPKTFYDIKLAQPGDVHPETKEVYEVVRAAEVGNIFPLNTKFTAAIDYKYTDEQGKLQPVYMGSYGIGPSRIMGVLVEKFHDDRGIVWPEAVAPFTAHLLMLGSSAGVVEKAEKLYQELTAAGVSVLFDDRNSSAGEKFADADLIGIPYRLVLSEKTKNKIELKKRDEKTATLVTAKQVIKALKK